MLIKLKQTIDSTTILLIYVNYRKKPNKQLTSSL